MEAMQFGIRHLLILMGFVGVGCWAVPLAWRALAIAELDSIAVAGAVLVVFMGAMTILAAHLKG